MRELIILIYLTCFKITFNICKLFPLKNKTTFLISFPENPLYLYDQLKKQNIDTSIVFLCQQRCLDTFNQTNELTYPIDGKNMIHFFRGIFHLATSKQIIADNYYGFLAITKFKPSVRCIQIWHAVGAIKQFGIKDPSNTNRTAKAIDRFKDVYARFDQIVVGSDFMGNIFKQAFLTDDKSILKLGVARTDFFFNREQQNDIKKVLYQANPLLKEKKVILYAPTFRKSKTTTVHFPLEISAMYESLKDDYLLILKLHPNVDIQTDFTKEYPDFLSDYSHYPTINNLLVITDILITDYSSIPMEFSFFKRKMIFYAYDLEQYQLEQGFWEDYEQSVPGPVVKNTAGIVDHILDNEIDIQKINSYAKKWTEYCDGKASKKLVMELFKQQR